MKIHLKYSKIVGVVSNVAIWRKEHTHLSCVCDYHTGINRGETNLHTTKGQHEKLKWSAYQAIKTDSCRTDKKCSYLTEYEMELYPTILLYFEWIFISLVRFVCCFWFHVYFPTVLYLSLYVNRQNYWVFNETVKHITRIICLHFIN
jgi:hypothetical protein